jgi:hypothetical protein
VNGKELCAHAAIVFPAILHDVLIGNCSEKLSRG